MDPGALGESLSYFNSYNYSTVKSALANADPSAASSLPASPPSSTMWVDTAEAKALGLGLPAGQASTDIDGAVGFSKAVSFGYDPSQRTFDVSLSGPTYDFIGVVEHEFSEVMGRTDLLGATLTDGTNYIYNNYSPLDLFHFLSPGQHTYTGTTANYFSVNNGVTNLDNFQYGR